MTKGRIIGRTVTIQAKTNPEDSLQLFTIEGPEIFT
jgi:hypothetical protein